MRLGVSCGLLWAAFSGCSAGPSTKARDGSTDLPVPASGGRSGKGGEGTGSASAGGGGGSIGIGGDTAPGGRAAGGDAGAGGVYPPGTGGGGGDAGPGGGAPGMGGDTSAGGRGGTDAASGGSAVGGNGAGGATGGGPSGGRGGAGLGGRGGSAAGGSGTTGGAPGTGGAPMGIDTECCHSDNVYACNNSSIRACTCAIDNTCCGVWLTDCAYNVERRKCGTCTAAPFTTEEGGYIRAAPWHGYAFAHFEGGRSDSQMSPTGFNAFRTGDSFCAVGQAPGNPDLKGRALMGFNLNQASSGMPGGGAPWTPTGYGVYYNLEARLNLAPLYIQLTAASGSPPARWCAGADGRSGNRPWSSFGSCPGDMATLAPYDGVTPLMSVAVVAQGGTMPGPVYDTYFEFCVANLAPY